MPLSQGDAVLEEYRFVEALGAKSAEIARRRDRGADVVVPFGVDQMAPKHSRDQCKWCGERATMRCVRCLCPLCVGCSYEGYCPACNFVGDAGGQGGTLAIDEIAMQLEKMAGIKAREERALANPKKEGGK